MRKLSAPLIPVPSPPRGEGGSFCSVRAPAETLPQLAFSPGGRRWPERSGGRMRGALSWRLSQAPRLVPRLPEPQTKAIGVQKVRAPPPGRLFHRRHDRHPLFGPRRDDIVDPSIDQVEHQRRRIAAPGRAGPTARRAPPLPGARARSRARHCRIFRCARCRRRKRRSKRGAVWAASLKLLQGPKGLKHPLLPRSALS